MKDQNKKTKPIHVNDNKIKNSPEIKAELPVSVILSKPDLADPNFAKSTILLVEHYEEGAMGIIYNSPTSLTLGVFARNIEIDIHPDLEEIPVYRGGPVDSSAIFIIHTNSNLAEKKEIYPNLYISNSDASIKELFAEGKNNFKIIMGYAAWGEKQLENEMSEGSWLSAPVNLDHVFKTDFQKVWKQTLKDMGVQPQQLILTSTEIH